jgi:DNA-binding response OmpR family regulator
MTKPALFVDDDLSIGRAVKKDLLAHGWDVTHVDGVDKAMAHLKVSLPEVILLDIDLPGISGLKFLEILKESPETAAIPVIMLTALGGTTAKIKGLETGADDYVVKPFSTDELAARMAALLRRTKNQGRVETVIQAGGVRMDLDRRLVFLLGGEKADLTSGEFKILSFLVQRKGYVLTNESLVEALARENELATLGSVYTHIKNIRKKLKSQGRLIESVHGVGYRFSAEE